MKKHPFCQLDEMGVFSFAGTNHPTTKYNHVEWTEIMFN